MLKTTLKVFRKATLALLVSVLSFGVVINSTYASAWTPTDNLNSYGAGDLAGNNGGTGWSAAWSGNTEFDINTTTTFEGAASASGVVTAAPGSVLRSHSGNVETTGTVHIACRRSDKSAGEFVCLDIRDIAPVTLVTIRMQTADLILNGATNVTLVTGYSVNTWYAVDLQFDTAGNTYQARACANANCTNEAYSSAVGRIDTLDTGVGSVAMRCSSDCAGTVFFDDIRDTDAGAATATTVQYQKAALLRRRR